MNTPVIVDFGLAYQNDPALVPPFSQLTNGVFPVYDIVNHEVSTPLMRRHVYPYGSQDWYMQYQTALVNNTRRDVAETLESYPSVQTADSDRIKRLTEDMTKNGHILLLPGTVYAFALRNRRWGSLFTKGYTGSLC